MSEVLALLQAITPLVSKTTLRQMSHVLYGMLVASGRILCESPVMEEDALWMKKAWK